MVAEYQPATGKYYYYTTDQINSTRVVTDDEGNVVYSAVHDPYGGVQQTWVNTFNPGWKFSGKEQDAESGLYYFGARYYDPGLYRFLSPDPVIPSDRALYNPQRWNLYGYCLGNPTNYVDLSGAETINILILRLSCGSSSTKGLVFANGQYIGFSLERPAKGPSPAFSCVPEGEYSVTKVEYAQYGKEYFPVFWLDCRVFDPEINDYRIASILAGSYLSALHNCIYIGDKFEGDSKLLGSEAIKDLDKIYLKETLKLVEMASYATQTDMVLYSFDGLDSLSRAAWAASEIQINVMITSVVTIMSTIMIMMMMSPCI